jgi:hypothetical protein
LRNKSTAIHQENQSEHKIEYNGSETPQELVSISDSSTNFEEESDYSDESIIQQEASPHDIAGCGRKQMLTPDCFDPEGTVSETFLK